MRKITFLTLLLLQSVLFGLSSQRVYFPDEDNTTLPEDERRGYYNRPYLRYEAEPEYCATNNDDNFLPRSFDQSTVQSEASNQTALKLTTEGDYVQWAVDEEADGLVIRFSIPDNAEGTGTQATISLYVDGAFRQKIALDSYWAWQYFFGYGGNNVPYNHPEAGSTIYRMRFDEVKILLEEPVPAGSELKLQLTNDDHYTEHVVIDFIELEKVDLPVAYADVPGIDNEDKFYYDGDGADLNAFIASHAGKTIYIPADTLYIPQKITINSSNTTLQGAGMWHTLLYFDAPITEADYSKRGIETNQNNITLDGVSLNTINNLRYYTNTTNWGMGKGLMGTWGADSKVTNVWIEHFECGAWIGAGSPNPANRLQISHCRFRNNYADGINLSRGSKNSTVEYCSFRNNGDDDMASWSSNNAECAYNTYRYNTSENCWRAAGIGFFGGKQNKAQYCVVRDPMETGLRVDATFGGAPYSGDGFTQFDNISVYHGGTPQDAWGNAYSGAIVISLANAKYNIKNISFSNIDLIDSKLAAINVINGTTTRTLEVCMENIHIDGTNAVNGNSGSGIYIATTRGKLVYKNISFQNVYGSHIVNQASPSVFKLVSTEDDPCEKLLQVGTAHVHTDDNTNIFTSNGNIYITGLSAGEEIIIYDVTGNKVYHTTVTSEEKIITGLNTGMYFVTIDNGKSVKTIIP